MLREFTLLVGRAHAEALSDALLDQGALSVTIEDADAETPDETALYGEPGLEPEAPAWRLNRIRALVDEQADAAQLLAGAAASASIAPPDIECVRAVGDADWVRITQAQFAPVRIGSRLWIVPSWHAPPDDAALVVRLDPGVAFGTGAHPTTRLCLAWLERHLRAGTSVLDYGCGSGILAIAAARLGAARVVGTDIDRQALAAAQANAKANEVIAEYTAPDRLPSGAFDVVLANILTNPLKVLAPALLARVAPGGALVLAGLLERQAPELIAAYAAIDPGVHLSVWASDDGWACVAGERAGAARR
jgi:ribosomal protein L11 methyltransferase